MTKTNRITLFRALLIEVDDNIYSFRNRSDALFFIKNEAVWIIDLKDDKSKLNFIIVSLNRVAILGASPISEEETQRLTDSIEGLSTALCEGV